VEREYGGKGCDVHIGGSGGGERIRREGGSDPHSLFSDRHCGSCWSSYSATPHPFFRFWTRFRELMEIA
jgi:hypothetical protein